MRIADANKEQILSILNLAIYELNELLVKGTSFENQIETSRLLLDNEKIKHVTEVGKKIQIFNSSIQKIKKNLALSFMESDTIFGYLMGKSAVCFNEKMEKETILTRYKSIPGYVDDSLTREQVKARIELIKCELVIYDELLILFDEE